MTEGLYSDVTRRIAGELLEKRNLAGYSPQQSLRDIPNYEKLTRTARWVMDRLPGFAEKPLGKALAWFNDQWMGKALMYLDVGAEALERAVGLGTQWAFAVGDPEHMAEFKANLSEAWYAGSLAADVANLPRFENGRLIVPTALPGMDAIFDARKRIVELTQQGIEPGEALITARDELYNSVGALQLEMQLQDAFFHIAADPGNILLAYLKPVEKLKRFAITKLTVGDLPEEFATQIAKFGTKLDELQKAGASADEIAKVQTAIETLETAVRITPWQEKVLVAMGELPARGEGLGARFLRSKWNPLGLTPQSRGNHLVELSIDNIMGRIIAQTPEDPVKALRALHAFADGTIGPEFGHMLASYEGRQIRGVAQLMLAKSDALMGLWQKTPGERALFNIIAETLRDDAHRVLLRIKDGEEIAVWTQLMEAIAKYEPDMAELAMRNLDDVLGYFGHTRDTFDGNALRMIAETLGDNAILTKKKFMAVLGGGIIDSAAEVAVARYGGKARGYFTKMAQMVKSAENLAFLRLNPGYPIRNLINGEFTMLGRGVYGLFSSDSIQHFWGKMGFEPARLYSGFGPAGIAAETGSDIYRASVAIVNEAFAGKTIAPDRIARAIANIDLGPADMGRLASNMESWQSARAYTRAAMTYMKKYARNSLPKVGDVSIALADELGVDATRRLEQALGSSLSVDDIDNLFYSKNLNLSEGAIFDDASRIFGADIVDNIIPADEASIIAERLIARAPDGPTAIWDELSLIDAQYQNKINAQHAEQIKDIITQTAARAEADPGSVPQIIGEMVDDFWGVHVRHIMDADLIARTAREATPDVAHQIWRKLSSDSENQFGRLYEKLNGQIKALDDGLRAAGQGQRFPHIREIRSSFQDVRTGWKKFFDYKNKTWDAFWAAKFEGKEFSLKYEQILDELDTRYAGMIDIEDGLYHQVDEVMGSMLPEANRPAFMAVRDEVARLRRLDRESVVELRRLLRDMPAEDIPAAYQAHTQERMARWTEIANFEHESIKAAQGDPVAMARYAQLANDSLIAEIDARFADISTQLAEAGKQTGPTHKPGRFAEILEDARRVEFGPIDERIYGTPGNRLYHTDLTMTETIDVIAKEFNMEPADFLDAILMGETPARPGLVLEPYDVTSLPNFHQIAPRIMPDAVGVDELYMTRTSPALRAMAQAAEEAAAQPPLQFANLSEAGQSAMRQYATQAKGWLSDAKYQAARFGAYGRDSALLNYNRRFNYNTFLGNFFPYEFWFTQSIFKWAIHTIDRPAMASTFFKMQKFLHTAFRPEGGFPSRLRGTVRIPVPFMPDWMGDDIFFDPMRTALPFQNFARPFEEMSRQQDRDMWAAQRVLEEMMADGMIDEQGYTQALNTQEGPIWERAMMLARQDDTEQRTSGFELMSMLTSPHAPIMWAYNALRGTPEKIGPFTPLTRSIKGITALLGIGPAGGLNIEGAIRRELGLPAFDQWDDYRVDRMLTSMAADGAISVDESLRAMIERTGPAFEEATRRAGIEYGVGALGSSIGLPMKAYPTGEEHLRELKDEYEAAWAEYEQGDLDALNRFYEQWPEYEARLALFKTPQERLSRFLIDEIWDKYNEMPIVHKREVAEHLGELFQMAFLNRETRSYDSIPPEMLQVWLKIIGGDPPGEVHYTETLTPMEFAPPEQAHRLEVFYDTRNEYFDYNETLWPIQSEYFKLEGPARKAFLREYPELKRYWDWRRDFMYRNPDLAIYLEDDPDRIPKYPSAAEYEEISEAQPTFVWAEWYMALGPPLFRLVDDMLSAGMPLTEGAEAMLEEKASVLGITFEELLGRLGTAYFQATGQQPTAPQAPAEELATLAPAALPRPRGVSPTPTEQVTQAIEEAQPAASAQEVAESAVAEAEEGGSFLDAIVDWVEEGVHKVSDIINAARNKREFQEQLKEEVKALYPGLKPEALSAIDRIGIDIVPSEEIGSAAGMALRRDYGLMVLESPMKVAREWVETAYGYGTIIHEIGHYIDLYTGGPYRQISDSPGFRKAVDEVYAMEESEYRNEPWQGEVALIKGFPDQPDNVSYSEVFAEVLNQSLGYLDIIPPPLRPYYERFLEYAPSVEEYYAEAERP